MTVKNGFSLVELLIAAGLACGLSLTVATLVKQNATIAKDSIIMSDTLEAESSLIEIFGSPKLCEHNLKNKKLGDYLDEVKNMKNTLFFKVGERYGRSATVTSINIENDNSIDTYGMSSASLHINIKPSSLKSEKSIIIPLKVSLDGSQKIQKCYTDSEKIIESIVKENCLAQSGTYNDSTKKCSNENFLQKNGLTPLTGSLTSTQLTTPASTASIANATTVNSSEFCINGVCRSTFTNQICPAGQILTGIQKNGEKTCKPLFCPNTTMFAGWDSDGSIKCRPIPSKQCATVKEYVSSIAIDGTITCSPLPPNAAVSCGSGQYIEAISTGAAPTCRPIMNMTCPADKYISAISPSSGVVCETISNVLGKICPTNTLLIGFDSSSNPVCVQPKFQRERRWLKKETSISTEKCDDFQYSNDCQNNYGPEWKPRNCGNEPLRPTAYLTCVKTTITW